MDRIILFNLILGNKAGHNTMGLKEPPSTPCYGEIPMKFCIFQVRSSGSLHLRLEIVTFEAGDNPAATVVEIEKEFNQDLNESSYDEVILLRVSVLCSLSSPELVSVSYLTTGEHTPPEAHTKELCPSYLPHQPAGPL